MLETPRMLKYCQGSTLTVKTLTVKNFSRDLVVLTRQADNQQGRIKKKGLSYEIQNSLYIMHGKWFERWRPKFKMVRTINAKSDEEATKKYRRFKSELKAKEKGSPIFIMYLIGGLIRVYQEEKTTKIL